MKILMLTPYLPYPPSSGGQIRTFYLLKYLSKNNDITLISLYKNAEEKKYLNDLKKYCHKIYACKRPEKPWQIRNIMKAVFFPYPFLIVRNFSVEAQEIIKELLEKEKYDVIHAETFYIMPHLPATKIPILLVEQTIEYRVYQHFVNAQSRLLKPLFYFDIQKLKKWERFYWKKANLVATVSETDKDKILALEPNIKLTIVPNGAGDEMMRIPLEERNLERPTLLFMGNFFWLQNVEAAKIIIDEIYPHFKNNQDINIIIAGQNARKKLDNVDYSNLKIIDIDPDDVITVRSLYRKATLFIAPIKGPGGTRLKILAAMASGLPIITTKTGIEGLGLKENNDVVIANNKTEFIKKIKMMLEDKKFYRQIQTNSYYFVRKNFSWENIALHLETTYKELIHFNE